MNNDKPIFVYVGTGYPDIFMAAMHEIIQESKLPIVIVPTEEPQHVLQPLDFHIPDIKIEDIIQTINIKNPKHKPSYNYKQKPYYKQTYRQFRDIRDKIKMQTYRIQRTKK